MLFLFTYALEKLLEMFPQSSSPPVSTLPPSSRQVAQHREDRCQQVAHARENSHRHEQQASSACAASLPRPPTCSHAWPGHAKATRTRPEPTKEKARDVQESGTECHQPAALSSSWRRRPVPGAPRHVSAVWERHAGPTTATYDTVGGTLPIVLSLIPRPTHQDDGVAHGGAGGVAVAKLPRAPRAG